jgi:hypothetical protein
VSNHGVHQNIDAVHVKPCTEPKVHVVSTLGLWKTAPEAGEPFGGGERDDVSGVWFLECMQLKPSRMGRKRGGECRGQMLVCSASRGCHSLRCDTISTSCAIDS